MYPISDTQIEYILDDIRARGVEMESLQQNLLDHVCCIIEQNLEVNGDFETFYQKTIQQFYKDALWEIEEETISLLTFKNYYTMKKIMINSGFFSASMMILGILFKFMHWPGASIMIVLGILSASFIFLPLVFTLKAKEKQNNKDKVVIGLGAFVAILTSLSILFKIMHWPYANIMNTIAMLILIFVFLPIYFLAGIRNPETKVNTITSSVLIVLACGLLFTLMRTPRANEQLRIKFTQDYIQSQKILLAEQQLTQQLLSATTNVKGIDALSDSLYKQCEVLKSFLLHWETGVQHLQEPLAKHKNLIGESTFGNNPFLEEITIAKDYQLLETLIKNYNSAIQSHNGLVISENETFIAYFKSNELLPVHVLSVLTELTQIQMQVLQNQSRLLAKK